MKKPGFKVIHVQDLDYRSSCQPFTPARLGVPSPPHKLPLGMPKPVVAYVASLPLRRRLEVSGANALRYRAAYGLPSDFITTAKEDY